MLTNSSKKVFADLQIAKEESSTVTTPRITAPTESDLIRALAPRPLVWLVTQAAADARPRIATFSAVTIISNVPPVLLITIQAAKNGGKKQSSINMISYKYFSINVPAREQLVALVRSSGPDIDARDRPKVAEINLSRGTHLPVYYVENSSYIFECSLRKHEFFTAAKSDIFWCNIHVLHRGIKNDAARARTFVGALDYEHFVTEAGIEYIEQPYLNVGR